MRMIALSLTWLLSLNIFPMAPEAATQVTQAGVIYNSWSDAVVQIVTPFGTGSGLIFDNTGLILTNAHVVAGTDSPAVKLSPTVKVQGRILAVDEEADLAVIQVGRNLTEGIATPALAENWREDSVVGDPVFVIGFPLLQGRTITSGIISRFDSGVFLTDASINSGNSGGPVFNSGGRVIGIATFLISESVGAGISGVVDIGEVAPIIQKVRLDPESYRNIPPSDRLPVIPDTAFSVAYLREAAQEDSWPTEIYDLTESQAVEDFTVQLYTPPLLAYLSAAEDRLEDPAEEEDEEPAVPLTAYQDITQWQTSAGAFPPVVVVRIIPRLSPSMTAILGNALGAFGAGLSNSYWSAAPVPLEARGTFGNLRVYHGPNVIRPAQVQISRRPVSGRILRSAYVVLLPDMFEPVGCEWPSIRIQVENPLADRDELDRGASFPIPEELKRQVWQDFSQGEPVEGCD